MLTFLLPLCALASYFQNRDLLLTLFPFLAIAPLVMIMIPRARNGKDGIFMVLILSVSMALLMSATFSSTRLLGWDIHGEYLVFQQVMKSFHWQPELSLQYNSVTSVTLLPAVLSVATSLDGIQIFKFVYPILYSVLPVVLYRLYRRILPAEAALLAVFLFIGYPSFYIDLTAIARQEIAEILLALALCVLIDNRYHNLRGRLVLLLLSVGIVMSHYSVAYLYIAILIFSYLILRRETLQLADLTTTVAVILIGSTWYIFVTGGGEIRTVTLYISTVASGVFLDFFSPFSRPSAVIQALGLASTGLGILHELNRLTSYLVVLAIFSGFALLVLEKRKEVVRTRMLVVACFGIVLLISAVALPYFAGGLNLSRLYHIALIFVSPCFAYGIMGFVPKLQSIATRIHPSWPRLSKRTVYLIGATLLLSYFLFNSGWVWAVSGGSPTSVLLDPQRMLHSQQPALQAWVMSYYVPGQDAAGAQWLSKYHASNIFICADLDAQYNALTSYGGFPREPPKLPDYCNFERSYVFLRLLNTEYGVGSYYSTEWRVSEIYPNLITMERVYSNGGATIYAPDM